MRLLLAGIGFLGILVSGGSHAWAQQQFDGRWNIEAIPTKGTCTRVYRYAVSVENGAVHGNALRRAMIGGALDPDGRVQGSVERNKTRVEVTGRVAGRSGSGHWTTKGRLNCSGQWQAEKR